MIKPDMCIYHGNCADGFTAAWVIWSLYEGVEFVAGVYGQEPPDVTGKNVVLVDFSYKAPVLHQMAAKASTIVILDHHKTAQADLADLPPPIDGPYDPQEMLNWQRECNAPASLHALFDMARSSAQIAWDFFYPGQPRPVLVDYVGDRDLWRFALPHSRAITAWIFSYEHTWSTWSELVRQLGSDEFSSAVAQGEAIERKHHKDIAELVGQTARPMILGGHRVLVANLPSTLASDAAGAMAEGQPFAACYFDRNDGQRIFSLRSRGDSAVDVSEIAKAYGGGGHKNAAGFQMPIGWEGDTLTRN